LQFGIGETPLTQIEGIFVKLECVNPCGSVKDRIVDYILRESSRTGVLKPGQRIIEATSGNTGIAMAYYGRQHRHPVSIVMPEHMTEERKKLILSFGAELILVSREGSFAEAARVRDELATKNGWFNPDQFSNPLNPDCHYKTTGREILRQISHFHAPIGAVVAGVGTGGTLIGVARAIKEWFPSARIIAVEPSESAIMSGGPAGEHGIQGIGDGFIPAIASDGHGGLHPLIDDVIAVSTDEARGAARYLTSKHGICVGMSSGANFAASKRVGTLYGSVVTVFADGYSKYSCQGLTKATSPACPFRNRCPEPLPGGMGVSASYGL
jgi:cysteine synthase A